MINLLVKWGGGVKPAHSLRFQGFTLAEVLITIGVIGVVAAITLPTLITNIQERVRTEQTRLVKYKLTNATSEMNVAGLIQAYPTTGEFVEELSKHYKVLTVCDKDHLTNCWPYRTINLPDATGASGTGASNQKTVDVTTLTNGTKLSALALGTANTETVGIVTGDGTPMIMVFSPECQIPEDTAHQQWSKQNGKPETNATTNCISAIFDINGPAGPNRLGYDVRTLNSLFGFRRYAATAITKDECLQEKKKGYGITACNYEEDYWAGAMKKCHDIGMHLPSSQTLANIAGAVYGRTDIGPKTSIMRNDYSQRPDGSWDCKAWYEKGGNYHLTEGNVICTEEGKNIPRPATSAISSLNGSFWAAEEVSSTQAYGRLITSYDSSWYRYGRNGNAVPLCLGD